MSENAPSENIAPPIWSPAMHYNHHASPNGTRGTALRKRASGPLYQLKKYHNSIKRHLIETYAHHASNYLDIGCGRGGDIRKICDANVARMTGIDISPLEIAEAQRRVRETKGCVTSFEFLCGDALTWTPWQPTYYDVVACMFCIHYFFESKEAATSIIQKASSFLKPHGIFMGCVPDAEALVQFARDNVKSPFLTLTPHWTEGKVFGNPYVFEMRDTVTAKTASSDGSVEYLVHFDALVSLAKEHGLHLVESQMFDPPHSMDGAEVSRLFRWFAFKKLE